MSLSLARAYESRGAGSGSQHTEHNFSYTEIRNQRHRICSGETAPFVPSIAPLTFVLSEFADGFCDVSFRPVPLPGRRGSPSIRDIRTGSAR